MKRPNTLIIEDNLFLVKVLRNLLLYQSGRLEFAKTRDEANDILGRGSFDLVLSDFHLGDQNSLPILENLSKTQTKQRKRDRSCSEAQSHKPVGCRISQHTE